MGFSRRPDATLYEEWDDATRADMDRLNSYLNIRLSRGAVDPDGSFLISVDDVSLLTRTRHPTRARERLMCLPERSGVSLTCQIEPRGRHVCVRMWWPKFIEYQTADLKVRKIGMGGATRGARLFCSPSIPSIPGFDDARAWFDEINRHETTAGLEPTPFGHGWCMDAAGWFRSEPQPALWAARAANLALSAKNGWNLQALLSSKRVLSHLSTHTSGFYAPRNGSGREEPVFVGRPDRISEDDA